MVTELLSYCAQFETKLTQRALHVWEFNLSLKTTPNYPFEEFLPFPSEKAVRGPPVKAVFHGKHHSSQKGSYRSSNQVTKGDYVAVVLIGNYFC